MNQLYRTECVVRLYRSECVLPREVEIALPTLNGELEASVLGSWTVVGSSRLLPRLCGWGDIDLVAPTGYTEVDARWVESRWERPPHPPCRCHRSFSLAPCEGRQYWVTLKLVPMREYERIIREYEQAEDAAPVADRVARRLRAAGKWDFYRDLGITVGYANDACEVAQ